MSNKMTLILALVLGVALIVPAAAKAEVQNVKVSGDITIYGFYRADYDLITDNDLLVGNASRSQDSEGYYASITKLRVDADLTDNVSATIRLLNERDWDAESDTSTSIDLDLAYIVLKEILYSPLTLTLGRQNIKFGNELIVGEPGTNAATADLRATDYSAREAFDAIRATWDFDPLTVDAIIVKIDETGAVSDDHDLYGVNAAYNIADNAEISAYWFADIDEGSALALTGDSEAAERTYEEEDTYVLGIAGNTEPVANLTLSGEVAYQYGEIRDKTWGDMGSTKNKDRKAWALDAAATYAFDSAYSPTLGVKYLFRSGEESANNGDYEAWNPLYEDQLIGEILDLNTNLSVININGSVQPIEDLTLVVDYFRYTFDESYNGGAFGGNTMTNDDDAGDEIDLTLTYDYTEDVQLGLLAGFFWPGSAYAEANDDNATEVLGSVTVSF